MSVLEIFLWVILGLVGLLALVLLWLFFYFVRMVGGCSEAFTLLTMCGEEDETDEEGNGEGRKE